MRLTLLLASSVLLCSLPLKAVTVAILTTGGKTVEGETSRKKITVETGGARRDIPISKLLSVHSAAELSAHEQQRIAEGIAAITGTDRARSDQAVEELTAIGVPVVTPLLKAYKDTDQHEPNPLYRLFTRVMPSHADGFDRSLALVRLVDGEAVRGSIVAEDWMVDGTAIPAASVRRVAVKQKMVRRNVEVHSLRHSNQIEFMDTGVVLTAGSQVESTASGFARLSWSADDWASGPDGLTKPAGNYKTHLVNGHPFGALVGRTGAAGEMFFLGRLFKKAGKGVGRLYLAVNDNRHWQNNLGSYKVILAVSDAYDAGDPY